MWGESGNRRENEERRVGSMLMCSHVEKVVDTEAYTKDDEQLYVAIFRKLYCFLFFFILNGQYEVL